MRKVILLLLVLGSFAGFSQDSTRHRFGLGIVAEAPKFNGLSNFVLQGEYFTRNNYFGTVGVSFFPEHKMFDDSWRNYDYRSNGFRISLMAGKHFGKKQNGFELSVGYTGILKAFDDRDFCPQYYKLNAAGQRLDHYASLNAGYRMQIGKYFYVKPEISFNYRVAGSTKYSTYDYETYNGYVNTDLHPKMVFLENFVPAFRIGFGILLK